MERGYPPPIDRCPNCNTVLAPTSESAYCTSCGAPISPSSAGATVPPAAKKPWFKRKVMLIPAVIVGLLIVAAISSGNRPSQETRELLTWYRGVEPEFEAMREQMTDVGRLSTSGQYREAADACQVLSNQATALARRDSPPDSGVAVHWNAALRLWANGGKDCHDGLYAQDSDQIARGTESLEAGSAELEKASAAIQKYL